MFALIALIQDDGLTFHEVLSDIPHDAAAIFVYLLVAIFVFFIWWGSRSRPSQGNDEGQTDDVRRGDDEGLR